MSRHLGQTQSKQTPSPYRKGMLRLWAVGVINFFLLTACSHNDIKSTPPERPLTENTPRSYIEDLLQAEFILQRKGPHEAFEYFYTLANKSKNTSLAERQVHIAIATKNESYIERSSNLWLSIAPKSESAYSLKFQILMNHQQPEETAKLLTRAIKNDISLRFLTLYLEENLHNNQKLKTLSNALSKLPQDHKSNQHIQLSHAHLSLLSGQYQTAIDIAKQLLTKQSIEKNESLHLILAFSQKNLDDLENAIKTLSQALKTFPNSTRLLTPLLDFLVENEQIDHAYSLYKKARLETPEALQVGISFMQVLVEYMHPKKALQVSMQLPEKRLGLSDQIQYLTAISLAQLDRKNEAINRMHQVGGSLRNNATHKIASWLYDQGQENRINEMVLSRTLRENMPEQVSFISLLHEEKGHIHLSYELLSHACKALPESNVLRYKKALLAETLGKWQITEIELKKLLLKDPENPQYLNALGYTLLTRTQRIDEAMKYIEFAYEKSDNDPAIIDSLGWGHFMKGQLEQSSYYLKKAWDILPDTEIAAHYGESLWKQRHYAKALEIWESALITSPNNPLLLDTIKRLSPSLLEKQ